MKKVVFLIVALFLISFVSAFDFPSDQLDVNIFQGNLTNLSEMQDVNIPTPNDDEVLTYDTATGKWISEVSGAVGDTNETTRVNAITGADCGAGDYSYGFDASGNIQCRADQDSGAVNIFDQVLNTTSNVTFNNITITENIATSGNLTLSQKITFAFGEIIDNIIDGWIRITGSLNVTGNISTDSYFIGNGSQLTGLTLTETDPYWTANQSSYSTTASIFGFNYWNDTFATFNKTYADTLYADISVTGDNTTWNQSFANTLYADISVTGDNSSWNETHADTLYADISVTGDNSTWNESHANTLYYDIGNSFNFWNDTYATFNKTYADTLYSTIAEPLWSANYSAYNDSWSSTYNASYDTKADYSFGSNNFDGTGNFTSTGNITASYFFGNGSQLTGIAVTESDPYWTANQSSYSTTATIFGFNYYNSSDFDIADYFTSTQILDFGYYNSSDFSIGDYYSSSDIDGFNYWNSTWAGFNKTYADTLYASISVTGDNATWNQSFANTLYSSITEPLWSANYSAYNDSWSLDTDTTYSHLTNFTDDLGDRGYTSNLNFSNDAGYYNSSDFSIGDYSTTASIFGFNYWNNTWAGFNKTYADTLYADISVTGDNSTWNESHANTLYSSITEPLWSANYSAYNDSWSSTYNSTYDTWAYNQTLNTSANLDMTANVSTTEWFKGKFNWTTTDEWSSFDGSTFDFNESNLETTYFLASAIQVITGSGAGDLEDIQTYNRTTYNVTESNSDYELRVNFTGITEFTTLLVRHKTSEVAGHSASIQIWDYSDSAWEGYGFLSEELTATMQTFGVYDSSDHINGGVVQVRFYQVAGPPNEAHIHQFDWVGISKGYGTPVGEEADPLSIHKDGAVPLTANWGQGAFNLTNTDSWFLGKVAWATIQDRFLTAVDDIYIYMSGTTATFNETKLNSSIDARAVTSESDPYWTANQSSYSTTAEILAFGYYNSSDFVITDYFTKTQIENFGYYNSSDFDIADYFTSVEVLAFNYYNSSNFDIADYFTSATILGFNYYNSTDFSISDYYTKTQIDNFNYYNATDFDIADYATDVKVDSLGNWSADKSDYFNTTDILGFSYYNSSNFDIADYYSSSDIDGFNYWNDTYATFNKTYADTLYADISVTGDNSTWNESHADTLYSTIAEPLWSANYSAYNDSWSSTYNATYDAKADYSFGSNNFDGTGNFTSTGNITASYFFGNGSQLTGIAVTESDPYWTGNQSNVAFTNVNEVFDENVNITKNLTIGSGETYMDLYYNGTLNLFDTLGNNALFTDNVTASYFIGNGSQLTDITLTESDPYWTANQSSYSTTSSIFGFNYYNSSDFDIADYYTSTQINGFSYYNATNFDIADYPTLSDILGFSYYNSSDFDIADYFTSTQILNFGYYNSSDFSISDYYSSSDIDGFNYWNDTWAGFNKTYADTLYYDIDNNVLSYWNSTWAGFNKTYADTLYSTIAEPLWTANQSSYFTSATILGFSYYNSSDFDIADYRTLTNNSFGADIDLNDNNLIDVNDIGTTTDEIDDIYVGTNQKIYFGDGQESSVYFNGSHMIWD